MQLIPGPDHDNLEEMAEGGAQVVAVEVQEDKSDEEVDEREREDVQKGDDELVERRNNNDVQKDEDERQNDKTRGEHSDRQGSRAPPPPIPITNIPVFSDEVEGESPPTPLAESGSELSSKAVYVKVFQESCTDARFDARQQQVVGSVNKETQEVRDSPDGCNSSQS